MQLRPSIKPFWAPKLGILTPPLIYLQPFRPFSLTSAPSFPKLEIFSSEFKASEIRDPNFNHKLDSFSSFSLNSS